MIKRFSGREGSGKGSEDPRRKNAAILLSLACTFPLSSTTVLAHVTPAPVSFMAPVAHHTQLTPSYLSGTQSQPHSNSQSHFPTASHSIKTLLHLKSVTPTFATLNSASNSALNLSSGQLSFLAGALGNFGTLTIDVGGRQEVPMARAAEPVARPATAEPAEMPATTVTEAIPAMVL